MPFPDHFALLAPFYEKLIPLRDAEALVRHLALPVDGPILDAGGGTGRVAAALREHAPLVVVADESLSMLRQAARKDGLAPLGAHTESLPFPKDTFPRILMVDALHHVADQQRTARELWRVLAPGGLLVIEEPDVRRPLVKGIAVFEKLALMRSHFLSPPHIAALFPPATASILTDDFNAWVLIRKP